jgi:hypothetical protein
MSLRTRFAAVYAALGLVLAAAAAGAYVGAGWNGPVRHPRCWVSGPDVSQALYSAAYCRFGRANVVSLGWMPHIAADGAPTQTLQEVMVERPAGGPTYWLARVQPVNRRIEVRQWTACGAVC